jgi:anti-sigma regulatory factor (Ser/Thr protein kinase)
MKAMLTVPALDEQLENVQTFIDEKLREGGFSARAINQVMLAAEEIFINIAHYAYSCAGDAEISAEIAGEVAVITFTDAGRPYNPLESRAPDITLSAGDRQPGGLGIFMTRKLTDGMEYEYAGGKNVLRIKKRQMRDAP